MCYLRRHAAAAHPTNVSLSSNPDGDPLGWFDSVERSPNCPTESALAWPASLGIHARAAQLAEITVSA